MKSTKRAEIKKTIVFFFTLVFSVCDSALVQSNQAGPQTKQESQIKKPVFEVTPIQSDIYSKDEHMSITVNDTLNLKELGISRNDLLDYDVYLYVHSLNATDWWRQNPATASGKWTAQAYLGGKGINSAKDGEVFQIVAIMAKLSPSEKVNELRVLKNIKGVKLISEIRTMTVRRK